MGGIGYEFLILGVTHHRDFAKKIAVSASFIKAHSVPSKIGRVRQLFSLSQSVTQVMNE